MNGEAPMTHPQEITKAPQREELVKTLRWAVQRFVMGHTERFEWDAEEFYRETGFMAPGKSVPMEMAAMQPDSKRDLAWYRWSEARKDAWVATLRAAADALSATPVPEPGWESIESAPKNRPVLGVVNGVVRVINWGKTSHIALYGWNLIDQGAEDCELCDPTHWMPLPPPPDTARGEQS